MKYRKKSVIVDAFQMTKENKLACKAVALRDCPEWIKAAFHVNIGKPNSLYWNHMFGVLRLTYAKDVETVEDNDWIIRDVTGDLRLCKPDLFDKWYEPITDALLDEIYTRYVADVKAAATTSWKSPASLKPGLYVWAVHKYNSSSYELATFDTVTATVKTIVSARDWHLVYGDAEMPPSAGYWLVTECGKAVKVQN